MSVVQQSSPNQPSSNQPAGGWREPVALAALAIGTGYVLLSLLGLVRLASSHHLGVERGALAIGGSSLPLWVLVPMAAAALACVLGRPATPASGRIARSAAALSLLGAGLELAMLVIGLFTAGQRALDVVLELLAAALSISMKVLVAWVLVRVARDHAPAGRTASGSTPEVSGALAEPAVASEAGARATGQPVGVAPAWAPDQAMGTVWTRAGDAATGAAGQQEATSSGWQVDRQPLTTGAAMDAVTPSAESSAPDAARNRSRRGGWATAAELAAGGQPDVPDVDAEWPRQRTAPVWRAADEGHEPPR